MSLIIQKWFDSDLSAPSAAGAYTLTAQAGSYTYTGQSATLTKSKLINASAGSYSISGQSASINKGFVLTASAGAYSYTGQAATLLKSKLISAQSGAYSYTGQDAVITYTPNAGAYTITAQAGAYSYSGINASINYVSTSQPQQPASGGYGFYLQYEMALSLRKKRKKQLEDEEEEARKIQDQIDSEIAQLLIFQQRKDEERDHIERIKKLVSSYPQEKFNQYRVDRALQLAMQKQTIAAFEALQREFYRMQEEEEIIALLALIN